MAEQIKVDRCKQEVLKGVISFKAVHIKGTQG